MPAQVGHLDSASLRKGLNERVHVPWRGPTTAVRTDGGLLAGAWAARCPAPRARNTTATPTASLQLEPRLVGDMAPPWRVWNEPKSYAARNESAFRMPHRPGAGRRPQ